MRLPRPSTWLSLLAVPVLSACLLAASTGCESTPPTPPAKDFEVTYDAEGEPVGLHRHKRWSERIGQGAQPQGEEAFKNLSALGYTTVLSVDGARPDVENAAKYGLKYVHVPFGYDGVPREAALQIARAIQLADGPVYVHCHHGRHRGPAGAMMARMAADGVDNAIAVEDLKASGCSPKYAGLYRDVGAFVPPTDAELAALPEELPEIVEADGLVDAMVKVSHTWENMKLVQEAAWGVPASNPDVAPAHEATMLWEHFKETARLDESQGYGERYAGMLTDAERAADALQAALRESDDAGAQKAFDAVKQSCNDCHTLFRN